MSCINLTLKCLSEAQKLMLPAVHIHLTSFSSFFIHFFLSTTFKIMSEIIYPNQQIHIHTTNLIQFMGKLHTFSVAKYNFLNWWRQFSTISQLTKHKNSINLFHKIRLSREDDYDEMRKKLFNRFELKIIFTKKNTFFKF